jgi:hypothetical protein
MPSTYTKKELAVLKERLLELLRNADARIAQGEETQKLVWQYEQALERVHHYTNEPIMFGTLRQEGIDKWTKLLEEARPTYMRFADTYPEDMLEPRYGDVLCTPRFWRWCRENKRNKEDAEDLLKVIKLYEDGWVLTDQRKDQVLDAFRNLRAINARLASE